jgi:hypothetical protein
MECAASCLSSFESGAGETAAVPLAWGSGAAIDDDDNLRAPFGGDVLTIAGGEVSFL